ncbi:helix-turn-helix domain-containing protein [Brevibacillus thermoruber]|uniref:helix-turn-helix domain-containing protein n=1 Tax=Brevibacillus thermoruber TaxID=33942 RepID=UPI0004231B62|nr:helix-turn-helix transcriptional regulator [Brevibacillus thermoruber]
MGRQRSLRSEIEHHLKEHDYTLSKLGELTGINPGHLNELLNGDPPRVITIGQLDAMAAALGQAPGWLYELYEEECFSEGKVSRSRVVPFLVRCAEIGRHDCMEQVVSKLLENPKNVSILFSVAEHLFERGKQKESVPFYQLVIENEKDSHAERFVMSQYRLFRALQGTDAEKNWEAVIRFDPYRKWLPENHQLDALLQLANVCYTLRRWELVEKYADELRELAHVVYEDEICKRKNPKSGQTQKTERPLERHLVVYYGQGYLLKGVALKNQGKYEEAKRYVDAYADLSWFEILDETGQAEVQKFRLWATANSYTLDMLTGKTDILPDYIRFLADHPNEVLPGLVTILKSANEYGFSVDHVLQQFGERISRFEGQQNVVRLSHHIQFRYQLAVYLLKKGKWKEGLEETVRCLVLSDTMMDYDNFKRCSALFWAHLQHASDQQKRTYQTVMMKGAVKDERDFAFIGSGIGIV